MTGRDLMLYILANNLEDQPVFQNGRFLDFLSPEEAAVKLQVGESTIRVWFEMGLIDGIRIGKQVCIPKTVTPPSNELLYITNGVIKKFIKQQERKD